MSISCTGRMTRRRTGRPPTGWPSALRLRRPATRRRAARRLGWGLAGRRLRYRAHYRLIGHEGDVVAVVRDVKWVASEQGVPGLLVVCLYPDPAPPEAEPEGQAGQLLWEPGSEAERAAVVSHAAKPSHRGDPGAGQRGQVNAIAGVVMEVSKVQESGFSEVVVGQLEMPYLGRDHRLGERRQ